MNQQVQMLLKEAETKRLEKRVNHLASLGLFERVLCSEDTPGAIYDYEKQRYYRPAVIEVSDEEYARICKFYPPEIDKAENFLKTVARMVLWGSIGGGVTPIVFSLIDGGFDVVLFAIGFWTIISALFSFALAKVLIQISLSLKHK